MKTVYMGMALLFLILAMTNFVNVHQSQQIAALEKQLNAQKCVKRCISPKRLPSRKTPRLGR